MKKLLFALLLIVSLFAVVACSGKGDTPVTPSDESTSASSETFADTVSSEETDPTVSDPSTAEGDTTAAETAVSPTTSAVTAEIGTTVSDTSSPATTEAITPPVTTEAAASRPVTTAAPDTDTDPSETTAPVTTRPAETVPVTTAAPDIDPPAVCSHAYVGQTHGATCTAAGKTTYTCSKCGHSYSETIPATGHALETTVTAATCTQTGRKVTACQTCGTVTETVTLEATGHSYIQTSSTAVTCTEAGKTTYTCSVCGDSYSTTTAAGEHSYIQTSSKAATCTEAGTATYTCSVCGDSYSTVTTAAGEHSYIQTSSKAATCAEAGEVTYTCSVCGHSYSTATATKEHSYVHASTIAATCAEAGKNTYICSGCGDSYSTAIAATGHSYNAATGICSSCGGSAKPSVFAKQTSFTGYFKTNQSASYSAVSINQASAIATLESSGWAGHQSFKDLDGTTYTWFQASSTGGWVNEIWLLAKSTPDASLLSQIGVYASTGDGWSELNATVKENNGYWVFTFNDVFANYFMLHMSSPSGDITGNWLSANFFCAYDPVGASNDNAIDNSGSGSGSSTTTPSASVPTTYTIQVGTNKYNSTNHSSNYANMNLNNASNLPSGWSGTQYFMDTDGTKYTWYLTYASAVWVNEIKVFNTGSVNTTLSDLAGVGVYYSDSNTGWTKITCSVKKDGDYWVFVFSQAVQAKNFMLHMATPSSNIHCNWLENYFFGVYDPQGGSNDSAITDTVTPTPIPSTVVNYADMKALWLSQFDLSAIYTQNGVQRSQASFTTEIRKVLTNSKNLGMNTVIVQVRPYADSMYPSAYYPMSYIVVGQYGRSASYDPFAIIVEEAHALGLSVQAWINPMRAMLDSEIGSVGNNYLIKQWYNNAATNGTYVVKVSNRWYLNPAYPEVQQLIVNGAREILTNYNVDGLHMDDYFYPTTDASFDAAAYNTYTASGGTLSLADWRRAQLNLLVKSLYDTVKSVNSDLLFGISPAGNYNTVYNSQYADIYTWCGTAGFIDYICPQIYFGMEHGSFDFVKVATTFQSMIKTDSVKLIVGMSLGKAGIEDTWAGSGKNEWINNQDVLLRELQYTKNLTKCTGVAYFCYQYFYDPATGVAVTGAKAVERENFLPLLKSITWK